MASIAKFSEGDLVWFQESGTYYSARVEQYSESADQVQTFQLRLESNGSSKSYTFDPKKKGLMAVFQTNNRDQIGLPNLTDLPVLNEPEVLFSLNDRYQTDKFYTNSGQVMVAINPFKNVAELYSDTVKAQYKSGSTDLPPHVFGVAEAAYRNMMTERKNQSIIINGESGAGKTVTAKHIMKYLTGSTTDPAVLAVEQKVVLTNPVMEAFGNAKTERNDNSSRFGKFMLLQFTKGTLCGAKIVTYLLEKSRVTMHGERERTYHIFYQLFALPQATRDELGLGRIEDFAYLMPNNGPPPVDDAAEFLETKKSLDVLQISEQQQASIWKLLAAVLHLGNIEITGSKDESNVDQSGKAFQMVCKLLQFDPKQFHRCLTSRKITTRDGVIEKPNPKEKAVELRDSIAKFVYTCIFNWIVEYINKILASPTSDNFIGVLDIYGFEFFKKNSFEQFCINVANEMLQQLYNNFVFKLEQELYTREGIPVDCIAFADNKKCLDLLLEKGGIFDLLDEQSKLSMGTDESFLNSIFGYQAKVDQTMASYLIKPKMGKESFTIVHFADQVTYDSTGFLDKNRDSLPPETVELLTGSQEPLMRLVIPRSMEKSLTVASAFRLSLRELCDTIGKTVPYFIRCIKPNAEKIFKFDEKYTLGQLIACGILETVRMAVAGFPTKRKHVDFINEYWLLSQAVPDQRQHCKNIMDAAGLVERQDYVLGKTLIMMRIGMTIRLEKTRNAMLLNSAQKIISHWKMRVIRNKIMRLLAAAMVLMRAVARYSAMKHILVQMRAIDLMQKTYRAIHYKRLLLPLLVVQFNFRLQKKLAFVSLFCAVLRVQRTHRACTRRFAVCLLTGCITTQRSWRAMLRARSAAILSSTLYTQRIFRKIVFARYYAQIMAGTKIQRTLRAKKRKAIAGEYLRKVLAIYLQPIIRQQLALVKFFDPENVTKALRARAAEIKRRSDIEAAEKAAAEAKKQAEETRKQNEYKQAMAQHQKETQELTQQASTVDEDLVVLQERLNHSLEADKTVAVFRNTKGRLAQYRIEIYWVVFQIAADFLLIIVTRNS